MFDEHKEIYLFYPEIRACSARLENLKTLSEMTLNYERKINKGSALPIVSEANQRRYSSLWRYLRKL